MVPAYDKMVPVVYEKQTKQTNKKKQKKNAAACSPITTATTVVDSSTLENDRLQVICQVTAFFPFLKTL